MFIVQSIGPQKSWHESQVGVGLWVQASVSRWAAVSCTGVLLPDALGWADTSCHESDALRQIGSATLSKDPIPSQCVGHSCAQVLLFAKRPLVRGRDASWTPLSLECAQPTWLVLSPQDSHMQPKYRTRPCQQATITSCVGNKNQTLWMLRRLPEKWVSQQRQAPNMEPSLLSHVSKHQANATWRWPGVWALESGVCNLESVAWKLKFGEWVLQPGIWSHETRVWELNPIP